ncbi:unnamed protein product [Calypogeia fissa]
MAKEILAADNAQSKQKRVERMCAAKQSVEELSEKSMPLMGGQFEEDMKGFTPHLETLFEDSNVKIFTTLKGGTGFYEWRERSNLLRGLPGDTLSIEEYIERAALLVKPVKPAFQSQTCDKATMRSSQARQNVIPETRAPFAHGSQTPIADEFKHNSNAKGNSDIQELPARYEYDAEDLIWELLNRGKDSNVIGKGIVQEYPGNLEMDAATLVGGRELGASESLNCTQDLIREVEQGGQDGYYLSFKYLISLEENEKEFLMSVLRKAGYLTID